MRVSLGGASAICAGRGSRGQGRASGASNRSRAGGGGSVLATVKQSQTVSEASLRRLSPLDGMKAANLSALARNIVVNHLAADRTLFRAGDTDQSTIWLTSGTLDLSAAGRTVVILRGGTAETREPLAPTLPRKFTARAVEPIEYLTI